jgi:hypothetical protein
VDVAQFHTTFVYGDRKFAVKIRVAAAGETLLA